MDIDDFLIMAEICRGKDTAEAHQAVRARERTMGEGVDL